ncbi:MAG: EAL domain-containing protein [Epsilonproteobacteria bacterium]|nr:EAL domain-containing protein [Campylobacterota bacterium]OIO15698.1 MAG: hypothetical protein AUJ81_06520 [Helicobacteraceae bacterium CG1_02_36_14]PIP10396.1 MAG: hypothetical protein COX50_06060 [Sulfurimonas sp. CG23_combo_of_CG06-09_8_20_14_all_36_33]PIS24969.1 MAG: hypothetical protein COT46_07705 [Sulfurimonas sp. CG08_land_8_20_14_0_20_36_33]PIU34138.1 MAG: hypothetical protein COT05_08970 [Sulfurimonas sp. CG07_land_8_20_14_0_80_36_56]PIV04972.1 MAG: hypothetical protein COS56_0317
MLLTIQKFALIMLFIILTLVSSVFTKYFLDQKEKTASVILNSLKNDMSELSYILSKNITHNLNANTYRAVLDRTASNNDYILAILILDDNDVLVSTDPHFKTAPSRTDIFNDDTLTSHEVLDHKKGIEGRIRYYEGKALHTLRLMFLFDRSEINEHFEASKMDFALYFALLPILVIFLSWLVVRYFVATPLELLRQFAYYHNVVPKAFKLKELEAIRSSMAQTFARLDEEQNELYAMARTDSLSGLANRNALNEYTERLIADALHTNKEFAFLFLDIDHFKTVNDELGHLIGDELLKNVSSKITAAIPSNDFVARVGGDEFVVVLHQYDTLSELTNIIDRIQQTINDQWVIQTNPITISSSIGIAFYPKDGVDITSLMQHSSMAMSEAKKEGRAQYHFFTDALNKQVQETIALDKTMRQALINNEYELYYQPKTDVKSGAIVGAEALIRWISPAKGFIPPNVFIPLAEENGFIVELGDWVLKEAISQQLKWKEKGLDISIAINIAAKQLLEPTFEYKLTTLLQESQVDTSKITIEITEYLFLENNKNNLRVLNFIHNKGIKIALDDFGTGYSSLSYLKKFPIDILKIDKLFMDDYHTPEGAIFVETIVKMGQTLKMDIIAEGVEEKGQVEYLRIIDCATYQGYYCSRPLAVKDFESFHQTYIPN